PPYDNLGECPDLFGTGVAFSPTPISGTAVLEYGATEILPPVAALSKKAAHLCRPVRQASRAQPRGKPGFSTPDSSSGRETDSPLEGTGFEPSVPRQEKWSMPSSSDQTRVGRTLTLGGGAESSLEGREIDLSVSPKDILSSPYDLCANRSDRRQSREGDRWFESGS